MITLTSMYDVIRPVPEYVRLLLDRQVVQVEMF